MWLVFQQYTYPCLYPYFKFHFRFSICSLEPRYRLFRQGQNSWRHCLLSSKIKSMESFDRSRRESLTFQTAIKVIWCTNRGANLRSGSHKIYHYMILPISLVVLWFGKKVAASVWAVYCFLVFRSNNYLM